MSKTTIPHIKDILNESSFREYINFYSGTNLEKEVTNFCNYVDKMTYTEIINNDDIMYHSIIYQHYLSLKYKIFFEETNELMNYPRHNIISVKKTGGWITFDSYTKKLYKSEFRPLLLIEKDRMIIYSGNSSDLIVVTCNKITTIKVIGEIHVKNCIPKKLIGIVTHDKNNKILMPNGELISGIPIHSYDPHYYNICIEEGNQKYITVYSNKKNEEENIIFEIEKNDKKLNVIAEERIPYKYSRKTEIVNYCIVWNEELILYYRHKRLFYKMASFKKINEIFSSKNKIIVKTENIIIKFTLSKQNNKYTVKIQTANIYSKLFPERDDSILIDSNNNINPLTKNLKISFYLTKKNCKVCLYKKIYCISINAFLCRTYYLAKTHCFFIESNVYINIHNRNPQKLKYNEKEIIISEVTEIDFSETFIIKSKCNKLFYLKDLILSLII